MDDRDRTVFDQLRADANTLTTVGLLPIYEKRRDVGGEYKRTRDDVLRKLADHTETLTLGQLLHVTGATSAGDLAAVEAQIMAAERKHKQQSTAFANRQYVNQPTYAKNLVRVDRLEIRYVELTTRYMDEQRMAVRRAVKRKRDVHRTMVERYELMKESFLGFVRHVEDKRKYLKQRQTAVNNKTLALHEQLKDSTYDAVILENQVLTLMNSVKTLEACYTLLTWLSPAEWRKQFKVNKLTTYELIRSDTDLTRDNHEHYLTHVYGRTLNDYLEDVQLEPVPMMYWSSADQFVQTLEKLEKKTIDRIKVFGMINWRASDSKHEEELKKHVANTKFRNRVRSMSNRIKRDLADNEPSTFGYIRAVTHDDEYFRILKAMTDICRQLRHSYVDYSRPLKMFEVIANRLDYIAIECNKISNDQWERTELILRLINKHRDEMKKSATVRCNVVWQIIQHEKNRTHAKAAVASQKPMVNRSKTPAQSPPKKPKVPALSRDQVMYLKCFTYLTPEDVRNVPTIAVPEFKLATLPDVLDNLG